MNAVPSSPAVRARLDVARLREEFPILSRSVHGRPLVYLDSANTSQKPRAVIEATRRFYEEECANIHRGNHFLSEKATEGYEGAREKARRFLNAASTREIVFVRGTTEAINLVSSTFGPKYVKEGDEVLITGMEHHSGIVPWQLLCERTGARLKVVPIDDRGELDLTALDGLLTERTRIVSLVQVSNALGTVNPVKEIVAKAHAKGIPVLVDGAQSVPHQKVDVRDLDADFFCFSGHKVFGPTGIGVLYGKEKWLQAIPPYQGGGDMISSVTFERTTYNVLPYKFEAGTANIAGGIGLGAALDWLEGVGLDLVAAHEAELLAHGTRLLEAFPGLRLIGTARKKASVLSFVLEGVHPHDIGTILDREGIAIRTGHHCAQPVMDRYDVPATARASLALYNTAEELDALVAGLEKVMEMFRA